MCIIATIFFNAIMETNSKSEQELVNRLNNGEIGAFMDVYRKYAPLMQAFASKFTDHTTAEDLVQDVFMRIWVNRETSPIHDSLQAYLFRAIRNSCISYLEHFKIKASFETLKMIELQIHEANYFQSPEQLLIRKEQLEQVRQEIEKLPEKSRKVFKMAYDDDKKAAEIASELQISVRTVETQLYKALKTLRKVFTNKY
jgi:RNA polymerase sigma-70 factor (ECF subfamily)